MRRRLLLLVPLLVPLAWCPPAAAEPAFTLGALLARLAALPERRADFAETRRLGALDAPLQSRGTLLFHRGYVEKRTTWPVPERLEMDGDRLIITAGTEPPRVVDVNMAPELRTLMDAVRGPLIGDAAALARAFTPLLSGTWSGWTLDLVPRDTKLLRGVVLQGHEDQVDRLAVTQANGDEQVMTVTPRP